MRKAVKDQILQLFSTLQEAHKELQMYLEKQDHSDMIFIHNPYEYIDHHVNPNKLLVLGSPKVDAIVGSLKKLAVYPEGWEKADRT